MFVDLRYRFVELRTLVIRTSTFITSVDVLKRPPSTTIYCVYVRRHTTNVCICKRCILYVWTFVDVMKVCRCSLIQIIQVYYSSEGSFNVGWKHIKNIKFRARIFPSGNSLLIPLKPCIWLYLARKNSGLSKTYRIYD